MIVATSLGVVAAVAFGSVRANWLPPAVAQLIVCFFAAGYWMNGVFVAGTALVGRLFGCRIEKVVVGVPPDAVTLKVNRLTFRLSALPISGFVSWADDLLDTDGDRSRGRYFKNLPLLLRGVIVLSGPASVLLISAAATRDPSVLNVFVAWRDLWHVLIHAETGVLGWLLSDLQVNGFVHAVAKSAAVVAAINLLPIPVLNGGHLLFYILEMVRGQPLPPTLQDWSYRFGLVILLGAFFLLLWRLTVEAMALH